MKKAFWMLMMGCFVLGACAPVDPFVDARREAGQRGLVGQSTLDVVAVCYNRLITSKKDTYLLAETECQKTRRHAIYSDYTNFSCSFTAPSTVFYRCEK